MWIGDCGGAFEFDITTGTIGRSSDDQTAYTASYEGTIRVWEIQDWTLDQRFGWVHAYRYVREFTCEDRAEYRIEPLGE